MSKEKFVRDKPHVNIITLFVVFGLIATLSFTMTIYNSVILFSDRDNDSIPNYIEEELTQSLYYEVFDDRLVYQTYETTDSSALGHELGHNLGIMHDGATSLLELESNLFDDISTGVPILEFGWKFESLIEFIDSDSNGLFEPATDTVVGQTLLTNMIRDKFGFGLNGEPMFYSDYLSSDGKLKVSFYMAREHILLGRQVGTLAPGDLKSFLTFTDFTPITGGTKIALNLSLSSSHELIFTDSKVEANNGDFKIEYEWTDWIIRDDEEGLANTTIPSSPIPINDASIYINLGSFTNATYDPHFRTFKPQPSLNLVLFYRLPWAYFTSGIVAVIMIGYVTRVVLKRPGRVKY